MRIKNNLYISKPQPPIMTNISKAQPAIMTNMEDKKINYQ